MSTMSLFFPFVTCAGYLGHPFVNREGKREVLPWEMVDKSTSPLQIPFRLVLIIGQSEQATSTWSEAPSECFGWHLHCPLQHMRAHLHLTFMALKRKSAVRGKRAPRVLSIVGWFCQLPLREFGADSVVPPVCHRAHAAVRAPLVVIGVDAQNGSTLATTPGELTGVGTAAPSPRCDEPAQLSHGGWSDSPVR